MSYILLIEDNQLNADMVIHLLKPFNIEVRHTLYGLEGAKIARQEHPALIFMDFNLPDIDGRTLTLQLKKQLGGTNAPPIVALTARAGEREERLAEQFGCAAFVTKPFIPEELIGLLKQLAPDLFGA
jgi:CheY-like chemotaxis protein